MLGSLLRNPVRRRVSLVHVSESNPVQSFAEHVRSGLGGDQKSLGCQYLYDEVGSRLFEEICELPEYYPTRTEDWILKEWAEEMVSGWDQSPTIVELGSGSSTKTRRLIEASLRKYDRVHYVPIDISPTILRVAATAFARRYRKLRVTPFAGDYREALPELARRIEGPKLVVFLGSSLGNYEMRRALELLRLIAKVAGPGGKLLLGTDMVKPSSILEPAYDDSRGVTARFNLNLLARINRELGGCFNLNAFCHEARFNVRAERVEMYLVSLAKQEVSIPGAGIVAKFDRGEKIHTENSHKYTLQSLAMLARESGFDEEKAWVDCNEWFRVQRWMTCG